ncbi:dihydrodipicolinate synthase family protein [Hoeflea sp. YIM 152468]|uniref:dihydrodipicolinate synthase family protein n=1 Tax=Hoeflea sp. YIM 152468 TaxID=3031759 RepID=UPI0023DC2DA3|nr:dihydrodipicolinate synthase family protein [Hoeflea sp. YIM 152468]MDF1606898.1 dihydrodipicolinate synthase family protein [Hoeflea sp. YIM 152468]
MKTTLFGLSAALVTPYTASGDVDLKKLVTHAASVLTRGCDSVTLCGTTGEGYGLSLDERTAMQAALADGLPSGSRIQVGIMASAIDDAAAQSSAALDAGAAGLLLAPPFYMKGVDDDGLYTWFCRVFERIGAKLGGVIMYHIPGQTAVPLSLGLISRLRHAWPGVITGIKDSSGDWATAESFLAAHSDISVLVGDERLLPRAMAKGAEGSICGLANVAPELMLPVIHDADDGRVMSDLVNLIVSNPVIPAVKVLVGHLASDPGFDAVRAPLSDLDAGQKLKLVEAYDAIMAGT